MPLPFGLPSADILDSFHSLHFYDGDEPGNPTAAFLVGHLFISAHEALRDRDSPAQAGKDAALTIDGP